MSNNLCPVCGEGNINEVTHSKTFGREGSTFRVDGFKRSVCEECKTIMVLPEQSNHNKMLIINYRNERGI